MVKKYTTKNLIYFLEIIFMYVFQNTPLFSLQTLGFKALLLIPTVVSMCVFMNEKEAMVFGIIAGIFMDVQRGSVLGLHILILAVLSYYVGFFAEHIIKISMVNTAIISLAVTLTVVGVDFLLSYVLRGYGNIFYVLINHCLPSVLCTVLVTPVMYLINRAVTYYVDERGGV